MSDKNFNNYCGQMSIGGMPPTVGFRITQIQFNTFVKIVIGYTLFLGKKPNWFNIIRYLNGWTLKVDNPIK